MLLDKSVVVPQAVLKFLNRGARFIADKRHPGTPEILQAVDKLATSLNREVYFRNKQVSTGDSLFPPRCRLGTGTWHPPSDPHVELFRRLTKRAIAEYTPLPGTKNGSRLDKSALQWLKAHRHLYAVVDCDKGLGDAIIHREHLDQLIEAEIRRGFKEMCSQDKAAVDECRLLFRERTAVAIQNGILPPATGRFLLRGTNATYFGQLRVRLKLHKTPLGARPIANLTRSWTQPIGIWLLSFLRPIASELDTVAHSSADIVTALKGAKFSQHAKMFVIDARNLYPSLNQEEVLRTIALAIRRKFLSRWELASFAIEALRIALANQVVAFKGRHLQTTDGLATGFAPAVDLANITFHEMDLRVRSATPIEFYKRYVDDALVISVSDHALHIMNDFYPGIVWEVTEYGEHVTYLDLDLNMRHGSISIDLHRKPLHAGLYTPATSCHPPACLSGIALCEAHRILRLAPTSSHMRHLTFLAKSLANRGFRPSSVFEAFHCVRRKIQRSKKVKTGGSRKHALCIQYSSRTNGKFISKHLKRFSHLISADVQIAWRVQPSIFRRLYGITWQQQVG